MPDIFSNAVALSRMQFAFTAIFHMLWPVLTTGMAIYLVILEVLWLKTKNPDYYRHARFWSKLYVLNFGIGVASGLPMEFQFGTNWAPFSEAVGDFFGSILGFEGSMAFMLEAGFLGIMLFGWERVPPRDSPTFNRDGCLWCKLVYLLDFGGEFLAANTRRG